MLILDRENVIAHLILGLFYFVGLPLLLWWIFVAWPRAVYRRTQNVSVSLMGPLSLAKPILFLVFVLAVMLLLDMSNISCYKIKEF